MNLKQTWNELGTGPKILIGVVVLALVVFIAVETGVDVSIRGLNG